MEGSTNGNFNNYTSRVNFDLMDYTDPGNDGTDYSQKLYGNSGSQMGVAKSFKVYPGDKVSIRAYSKYYEPTSTTSNLAGFASALISAYGATPPGSGEAANSWSALNNYGAVVAGGGGHDNSSGSYPKAYVNLIVVDKKYNFLDGAWDQINGGLQVGATPTAHDELYQEYVAQEEGYVYVFVSNENPTLVEVYFDDVTVTHTPGNVIQGSEYYPFGVQASTSWTRQSNVANNFLYNGGTELNQTTQVYDLYYRNYDPVLGRFGQVDPMAGSHGPLSPYHFGINNPVRFNDPMGDKELDAFAVMDGPYVASGRGESVYRDMDPYGRNMGARIMSESIERQTWANYAMYLDDLEDFLNSLLTSPGIFSQAWNSVSSSWDGGAASFFIKDGQISGFDIWKITISTPKSEEQLIAQAEGGMLQQDPGHFEYETIPYDPSNFDQVMGMHLLVKYIPSTVEKQTYSKFNWVLTVSSSQFVDHAPDWYGAYHNYPLYDGKPTVYDEDQSKLWFAHNALADRTSQDTWYTGYVSVVGFTNGSWHVLNSFNFGWTFMNGKMDYNEPGPGFIPSWHYDSITNKNSW